MPDNKKHHYLPQFYLRNFGEGNSISVFNVHTRKHVACAPIRGQCQRAYLYGKDGRTESALARLESAACASIRSIIEKEALPDSGSNEYFALTTFVLFQQGRTPQAGARSNALLEKAGRAILRSPGVLPPELRTDVDRVHLKWKDPVLFSLGNTENLGHLLIDLKAKLLINESPAPFVTSDSAVVLFNSWCRGWHGGGVTGYGCSGLQIFLPISPRLMVLFWLFSRLGDGRLLS